MWMTTLQQLLLAIAETHTTGASTRGSVHAAPSHSKVTKCVVSIFISAPLNLEASSLECCVI